MDRALEPAHLVGYPTALEASDRRTAPAMTSSLKVDVATRRLSGDRLFTRATTTVRGAPARIDKFAGRDSAADEPQGERLPYPRCHSVVQPLTDTTSGLLSQCLCTESSSIARRCLFPLFIIICRRDARRRCGDVRNTSDLSNARNRFAGSTPDTLPKPSIFACELTARWQRALLTLFCAGALSCWRRSSRFGEMNAFSTP